MKTIEFEDFLHYAIEKGYSFDDVANYYEHYENLLPLKENLENLEEYINIV